MLKKLKSKVVIGLMSGISADGIDACLVRIFPDFSFNIIENHTQDYPQNIREILIRVFENKTSVQEVCKLNFLIGEYFAHTALELIKKSGIPAKNIDLIGSHGQTIYHSPVDEFINGFNTKSTLQIGEAAIIAEKTGITTISDFRTADIAAGGQGAPLVCFADKLIFASNTTKRAIQNIGGIANVTVLIPNTEIFAFDTGPGNVMMDYCANKYFGKKFDKNGYLASQGEINTDWLEKLLQNDYYSINPPKTTGRSFFPLNILNQCFCLPLKITTT